jgi:hypothetical protein
MSIIICPGNLRLRTQGGEERPQRRGERERGWRAATRDVAKLTGQLVDIISVIGHSPVAPNFKCPLLA